MREYKVIILQVLSSQGPTALRISTWYNDKFDVGIIICGIYGIQPIANIGNWSIDTYFEDSW